MFRGFRIHIVALIAFVAFGTIAVNPVGRLARWRAAHAPAADAGIASAVALAQWRQHLAAPARARRASRKPQRALTVDEQFSAALAEIQEQAQRARLDGKTVAPTGAALSSLTHQLDGLAALRPQVEASFRETGRSLEKHGVAKELVERNEAAQRQFEVRDAELARLARPLARVRPGSPEASRAVDRLLAFFKRYGAHPAEHVDLDHLPFHPGVGVARPPATEAEQFPALLGSTSVAAQAVSASAPAPGDLAPTPDVRLSPAVTALAASLGNDPVRIFGWVRNNVEWIPTHGSVQGSEVTLIRKKGNDADTASLLIALYRAAGIPARYVYGTIDVPVERMLNWVGGVDRPEAAQQVLGQGGVPNVALVGPNGVISAIRLEHVWVEAYLDLAPSRAAVQRTSDGWVALDPSFKRYRFTPPRDLASVNLATSDAGRQWAATASVDSTLASITHLDPAVMDDWAGEIPSHLEETLGADWNPADYAGGREIQPEERSVLPLSFPNRIVSRGAAFSSLPDSLRNRVTITLYTSEMDRALESPSLTYSAGLGELAGKRLGVTYQPASDADAATLQSYRDAKATSLPLYLIHVVPVVKVDDVEVARGSSVTMGEAQIWDVSMIQPGLPGDGPHSYDVSAGDEIVFGIDGNGLDQQVIHQRFLDLPSDTAAENLNTVALYYWAQSDALNEMIAGAKHSVIARLPSVGMFAAPLKVEYLYGIPRLGHYSSRLMDVGDSSVVVVEKSNGSTVEAVRLSGTVGSFLEGRTFDRLLNRERGAGISAVQLISDANEQQIPIHLVTAGNYAQVAPRLQIDPDVLAEIASAVQAGKEVLVPERAPVHDAWNGVGYIVEDPSTGAAAYLIKGGLHGGSDNPCDPEEEPEPVRVPVVEIVLVALVIVALVLLVLALPELIAAAGTALEATGAAMDALGPLLARLSSVLAIGATAAPAMANAAPGPRPGDGMTPPGDCTVSQHLRLQAAVDLYCHGALSCRSTSDCIDLAARRERWRQCALARTTINTTCFKGGNSPHYDEEVEAYNHIFKCECKASTLGCP